MSNFINPKFVTQAQSFPIAISPDSRRLIAPTGVPIFVNGDSPWCMEVQLTRAEIIQYLNNRQAKGVNAILFEMMEHKFYNNSPVYKNREGNNPFSNTSDWSTYNTAYFDLVKFIVQAAKDRNMLCFITPAYAGYSGSGEGWETELAANSDASLQAYGSYLATTFGGYGNIIWVMIADQNPNSTVLAKSWQIVTGMRSVRTDQIITAHCSRTYDAYSQVSGQTGFNFNTIYVDGTEVTYEATGYGRPGPLPYVIIEGRYENVSGYFPKDQRREIYSSLTQGGCGHFYGNEQVWSFGDPLYGGNAGPEYVMANNLESTGAQQLINVLSFINSFEWHKLVPKTDTSLVTTSLGSGNTVISAALSVGGAFAMVLTPAGTGFYVDMTNFNHSSVRGRWYDPTNGTYTNATGTPFTNTGTHAFTTPGNNSAGDTDWILVLD